jgi:predicted permease
MSAVATVALLHDLRVAVRTLAKSPGYFVTAVTTLGVAIAATSAMFGAVHAVLRAPLSITDPERLVICWETNDERGQPVSELSYLNFRDWQRENRSFSQTAAVGSSAWPLVLEGRGDPIRLASAAVSGSFFETLGVRPFLGRVFEPADDRQGAPKIVVLSHGLWVSRFGSDPQVVGSVIRAGEGSAVVVGVAPADFDFPRGIDVWQPVTTALPPSTPRFDSFRDIGVLFVIGRLREDVTASTAEAELRDLASRLAEAGAVRFGSSVRVTPLLDYYFGPVRATLRWLLAAVGVLLLIACGNVSALSLTQALRRTRERAIRIALGARGAALIRPWLIETVLISVASGLLGLAAARSLAVAVIALAPDDVPRLEQVSINLSVALLTMGVSVVAASVSGLGVLVSSGVRSSDLRSTGLIDALQDGVRATSGRQSARARSALLTFQIAMTVVLLTAAGLVLRSYLNFRRLDLGFDPQNVATLEISPRGIPGPPNEWIGALVDRIEALPSVEAAGAVFVRPLAHGAIGANINVRLDGQADSAGSRDRNPSLNYQTATPGYFRTLRITLKQGRLFDFNDHARAPRVAIVGESTARRLWPGLDPVGRRLALPPFTEAAEAGRWSTVVGVVSDVRYRGLDTVSLDVYEPALQATAVADHIFVRSNANPIAIAGAIHSEARRANPRVLVSNITTMEGVVSRAMAPWRLSVWMFTFFAAVAMILAAAGLFGVAVLDSTRRTKEFALRIALGARGTDIATKVLRSAASQAVFGIAVGLIAAIAGTRWMSSLLFGVQPHDPMTYAGVIGIVVGCFAIACALPAYRASRIDPALLLRSE